MNGHALHTLFAGLVRRTWLARAGGRARVRGICRVARSRRSSRRRISAPASAHGAKLPAPPESEVKPPRAAPDGGGLVARNMFCSTCAPERRVQVRRIRLLPNAMLIATSVGDEPRCTVRVPASEAQGSYGVGDTIPGVGTDRSDRLAFDRRRRRAGRHGTARSPRSGRGGRGDRARQRPTRPPPPTVRGPRSRRSTTTRSRSIASSCASWSAARSSPAAMRISPIIEGRRARRACACSACKTHDARGRARPARTATCSTAINNKHDQARADAARRLRAARYAERRRARRHARRQAARADAAARIASERTRELAP